MPRPPDPDLEERVLNAAQALWKRGGEKSLTMRAVAKAARSNTPAVYRRFKDRQDILRALLRRFQQSIREILERCASIEEMVQAYVDYAVRHPNEYDLIFAHAVELTPRTRGGKAIRLRELRPNLGLLQQKLAERFGGAPEDHTRLGLALWAAAHGTAMMLITKALPPGHDGELRAAFSSSVRAMLREASGIS
jgi:AcrR family transcriptional regulator